MIGGHTVRRCALPAGGEADNYIEMLRDDVVTLKAGMLTN